jgi:hypothetical protein
VAADVIAERQHPDPSPTVDDPGGDSKTGSSTPVDHAERRPGGQLEASHGSDVTDALVLTLGVVVLHPEIERGLGGLDGVETPQVEELLAHGAVQPFDLAGGGRRVGGSQEVANAVVLADAVEEHVGRLVGQPRSEDLAIEFLSGVKRRRL